MSDEEVIVIIKFIRIYIYFFNIEMEKQETNILHTGKHLTQFTSLPLSIRCLPKHLGSLKTENKIISVIGYV